MTYRISHIHLKNRRTAHGARRTVSFHILLLLILLTVFLLITSVRVRDDAVAANGTARAELSREEENRRFFTDLEVVTHEGETLRFYSDILKDRLVVISFFYTNCPTAQPALVTLFRLQKKLKGRLGNDVFLLTVSVDPEEDTPEVVRKYARNFNPKKGWLFLTGKQANINEINRRLGNTRLRLPEGHLRLFLLGNLKTGHWMRLVETAPEIALEQGLRSLSE
jgi:protein SCO1/2